MFSSTQKQPWTNGILSNIVLSVLTDGSYVKLCLKMSSFASISKCTISGEKLFYKT